MEIGCGTGACRHRDQLEVVMDLEGEHAPGGAGSYASEDKSCGESSGSSSIVPPRKVHDSFPNAQTAGVLNLQELLQSPEAANALSPSDDEFSLLWSDTQDHILAQPSHPSRPAKVATVWKEQPEPQPGRARTSSSIRTSGLHANGMWHGSTPNGMGIAGNANPPFAPVGAAPGQGSAAGLPGQLSKTSMDTTLCAERRRYCPRVAERCLWKFARRANKLTTVLDRRIGQCLMPFCRESRHRLRVGLCALTLIALGLTTLLAALLVDVSLVAPPNPAWQVWPDVEVHGRDVSSTRAVEVMLKLRHEDVAVVAQFELALFYEMHGTPPFSAGEWKKAFWEAAALERRLRDLSGWQRLCEQVDPLDRQYCGPGASLPSIAVPSLQWADEALMPTALSFDGGGSDALSLDSAVDFARQYGQDAVVLPTWLLANMSNLAYLQSFRTLFRFPVVVCQASDPASVQHEMLRQKKDAWKSFVDEELVIELEQVVASEALPFAVWYAGTNMEEAQLVNAVEEDAMQLLPPTFGLLWLCHVLYSSSFMIGTVAAAVLAVCAYVALVISPEAGATSLLFTFFVAGIGSDVIFSCQDLWVSAQSGTEDEVRRLTWTYMAVCRYPLSIVVLVSLAAVAAEASAFAPLIRQAHQLMIFSWILWLSLLLVIIPACELHDAVHFKAFVRLRGTARRLCYRIIGGTVFEEKTWSNIWDVPRTRLAKLEGQTRWFSFDLSMFVLTTMLLTVLILTPVVSVIAEANDVAEGVVDNDHNLMRSGIMSDSFSQSLQPGDFTMLPPKMDLCGPGDIGRDPNCTLPWCYLEDDAVLANEMPILFDGGCSCQRMDYCDEGTERIAKMTIVEPLGDDMLSAEDIRNLMLQRWQGSAVFGGDARISTTLHMLLSDWQVGISALGRVTVANISTGTICEAGQRSVSEICYCDEDTICNRADGYRWVIGLSPDDVAQATDADAIVSVLDADYDEFDSGLVDERWRLSWPWTVQVVLGFEGLSSGGTLLGNPPFATFQPELLDAQRALLRLCMEMPPELLVTSRSCWVEDFRNWLYLLGAQYRYPTFEEDFHDLALQYLLNVSSNGANYVWVREGHVVAYYLDFEVGLPRNATLDGIAANRDAWNRYLQEWVASVPVEDGIRAKVANVWATSELWVAAFSGHYSAEDQATSSRSWGGSATVAICCLLLVGLATAQELVLACGIMLSVMIVLTSLTLVLLKQVEHTLGMVEVVWISLAFLHCSSACLHAAGQQGNSKEMNAILQKLPCGWSLAGSACTSLVCLIPFSRCALPLCMLANTVVMLVVIASLLMALGPVQYLRVAIAMSSTARLRSSPSGDKRHLVSASSERRHSTEMREDTAANAARQTNGANIGRPTICAATAKSADVLVGDKPPQEHDGHTSQSSASNRSEMGSTAAPERLGTDILPPASGSAALPQVHL